MAKDVFWFSHDSNASRDIKLMQIKHLYDFWGIGVYWSVIEVLREQPEYKFSASESGLGLLCALVMCSDTIRFSNWFNDCIKIGLFEVHQNTFFSASLVERMKKWEKKKLNGSAGGRPQKTETITETKPKVKANQKHNRIEENRIEQIQYLVFYDKYPRKQGKLDCQRAWKKLKPQEMQEAIEALDWWFIGKDPKFYPYPASWLNAKRWQDEKPEQPKQQEYLNG